MQRRINISEDLIVQNRRKVGAMIRLIREKKEMSQTALAEKVGTYQQSIALVESGRWAVTIDMLFAISQVLDFEVKLLPRNPKDVSSPDLPVQTTP